MGFASLLAVLACGSPPSGATEPASLVSARAPQGVASAADDDSRLLGRVRLNRLEAVRSALHAALVPWGLEDHGNDCVLLFAETDEWLVSCGDDVDGFVPNGEHLGSDVVLWLGDSFVLSTQRVPYEQVMLSLVGTFTVRTNEVSGAKTPVLVVQDYDALRQNHPAFASSPVDEWAGIFLHEAFHAHQLFHPSVANVMSDFVPGPVVAKEQLGAFYEDDAAFREAVGLEYALLKDASRAELSPGDAREVLAEWVEIYDRRMSASAPALDERFPGGRAVEMDAFYTFLEGSARYVEARFVTDPPTALVAALSEDPDFEGFAASRGRHPSDVAGLGGIGSKYVYAIGMYLCLVLDQLQIEWKTRLLDHPGLLVGLVRELAVAP